MNTILFIPCFLAWVRVGERQERAVLVRKRPRR